MGEKSKNTRAQELANRFTRANNELITTIERFSEAKWQAICENDGRSIGVVVHHLATIHPAVIEMIKEVEAGQDLLHVTIEKVNAGNALHAQQNANCTKSETLRLLRLNGNTTTNYILQLDDNQLELASPFGYTGGKMVTAQQLIENNLINHIYEHLASIQKAAKTALGI